MQDHFASVLGYNVYLFGIVDECTSVQHNYVCGEEHNSKGPSTVASMIFDYLKHHASEQVRSFEHLVSITDGSGAENRNRIVCGFTRAILHDSILHDSILPNLKKVTMIMMEKGRTEFSPDIGFGLIRRQEKNDTYATIEDVLSTIQASTPHSYRNTGVFFTSQHFKTWNHQLRFKPIPHIRKKHLIQFIKTDAGDVTNRTREGYTGPWTDHGEMLLSGKLWCQSLQDDLVDVPYLLLL